MNEQVKNQLYDRLGEAVKRGTVLKDEKLASFTSFKVGGPADIIVVTDEPDEIAATISLAKECETPYYIIGNGSNLLVSDDGFRGVIVAIRDTHAEVSIEDEGDTALVRASAGCALIRVATEAARAGLTGLEFAAGIPGSLGGAVFMNAGAYGGEIKDCIVSAQVMNECGEVFSLSADELELSYRHSVIGERNLIVLAAAFRLKKGDADTIRATIADLNARRRDKQPLEYASAGSTFKRPEGYFAGKLIQDAGLAGYSVGDARVSEKHCGFIVNVGHADAADILQLITEVRSSVYGKFGVMLEPEVRMLGFE